MDMVNCCDYWSWLMVMVNRYDIWLLVKAIGYGCWLWLPAIINYCGFWLLLMVMVIISGYSHWLMVDDYG